MASTQGDGCDSTGQIWDGTSLDAALHEPCQICPFGKFRLRSEARIEAMMESAERGHCKACKGILEFLSMRKLKPYYFCFEQSNSLHEDELTLGLLCDSQKPLSMGGPYGYGEYEFFAKSNEFAGDQDTTTSLRFNQARFPRLSMPSGDTSSEAAFKTLRSWMSRCQEVHTLCRRPAHKALPRRVLEIQSIEPLRVRLVEDGARREGLLGDDYACVSHRWGPETESNSLKGSNLDLYKSGVPKAKLNPLIRDAIIAIFRLGLRLVWIDCFCIIQDSIKDWESEAADMGRIYENAFLTIAANTRTQENCGMFSTLPGEFEAFQVIEIRGEPIYIRKKIPHGDFYSHSQLLSRGWVFQERLLSNRFIHFTGNEIFWECREVTGCECCSLNMKWLDEKWTGEKRLYKGVDYPRTIHKEYWNSIMTHYYGTHLSFEQDKLPALAGIARRYAESCGGWNYLSGLWEEDLAGGLAWLKSGAMEPRPLAQVAPTWSWACLPRREELKTGSYKGHMSLVKHTINPPGADVYGGARSAEITVECPTLDVQVYRESALRLMGKHKNAFFRIWADFKPDPDDETKFRAVPDDSSCLLLLLYPDNCAVELDPSAVGGIVLMQQNSGADADGKDVKFERIGLLDKSWDIFVDERNEYAEHYQGGEFPWLVDRAQHLFETADYLVRRAKKRRVTLV